MNCYVPSRETYKAQGVVYSSSCCPPYLSHSHFVSCALHLTISCRQPTNLRTKTPAPEDCRLTNAFVARATLFSLSAPRAAGSARRRRWTALCANVDGGLEERERGPQHCRSARRHELMLQGNLHPHTFHTVPPRRAGQPLPFSNGLQYCAVLDASVPPDVRRGGLFPAQRC